jgi:predicted RNA binding protein YcfA (HicA-like mRNA interferase family)
VVRSAGSHHRLVHRQDPARATTVSVHKGRDLPRPILRAIIKQAGLTVEEFLNLI